MYLALHNVEYGFDTSETDPDYIQDEARIVREDTSDVCSAVRSPGEVVVTNKNYFSLWYKLYATAFAGTDRPELEVYSETTSTCAEGSLEAWNDYYGANPVPIDTLYFE